LDPLLGPFETDSSPDYFQQAIRAELSSVTEWIFFAAIVVIALVLYRNYILHDTLLGTDLRMQQKTRIFYGGLVAVILFVLVIAIIIITIWDPFFNY
jgi:hypothetical protein